jgi:hypothetical protein
MRGLGLNQLGNGEEMRTGYKARFGTSILMLAFVPLGVVSRSLSQTAEPNSMDRHAPLSPTGPALAPIDAHAKAADETQTSPEIFREIDDPNGGARWLLSRDLSHPGGPGELTQTGGSSTHAERSRSKGFPAGTLTAAVIHVGDRLILEEHSAVVEGRLEAVALGPAAVGSALRVRLTIGDKVVRARALAAGRAVLQTETGGRP